MKFELKIFDHKEMPDNGKSIICCLSSELDKYSVDEIKNIINSEELYLQMSGHKILKLQILEIDIAVSLIDKKNIFLLIDNDISEIINVCDASIVTE